MSVRYLLPLAQCRAFKGAFKGMAVAFDMATSSKQLLAKRETRYCGLYLPPQPIPRGRYLVHNHVKPMPKLGLDGFRAWTQKGHGNLVECKCDFGGCKNAELHKHHYRVAGISAA